MALATFVAERKHRRAMSLQGLPFRPMRFAKER